jgi:tripeptide aminopeptidase
MREKVLPHFHLIENAKEAMKTLGIEPIVVPVRGGTDGARLSFMGLPCPNLCTGGHNFHGKYEYIPIQSMERTVEVLIEIVKRYASWQ